MKTRLSNVVDFRASYFARVSEFDEGINERISMSLPVYLIPTLAELNAPLVVALRTHWLGTALADKSIKSRGDPRAREKKEAPIAKMYPFVVSIVGDD